MQIAKRKIAKRTSRRVRTSRLGLQAKHQVGCNGSHPSAENAGFGTYIRTNIQAKPDEAANAAKTNLFGTKPSSVACGDAGHFGEIVHGSEFHVARTRQLAHGFEFAGDAFSSGNAGLRAAIENSFDGVERGVVDAFSEGEVESVGCGNVVERQHLKGFEDGKRNAARRLDGGGIEGRSDGTSPL